MYGMTVNFIFFCTSSQQQLSSCGREGKEGNMYVPLQVGVFFLLLFFLKVALPALMVCVLISFYKFFFLFQIEKESSGGEEEF